MFIINEILKKDKIPAEKMDELFKQHVECGMVYQPF